MARQTIRINPPKLLKSYYSVGAMVYSIVLPALAGGVWLVAERLWPPAQSDWAGLCISVVAAYSVAYFVPEPLDSPLAGKFRLTREEAITAVAGGFLTFATVLGVKCLAG
jgi:hypothetical protein